MPSDSFVKIIPDDIVKFVKVRQHQKTNDVLHFLYKFHLQYPKNNFRAIRCLLQKSQGYMDAIDAITLYFSTPEDILEEFEHEEYRKSFCKNYNYPFTDMEIIANAIIPHSLAKKEDNNLSF